MFRLTESDRFGPLLLRPVVEVVGLICADTGASPDWSRWNDEGVPPGTRASCQERPPVGSYSPEHAEAQGRAQPEARADPPPDPHRRE